MELLISEMVQGRHSLRRRHGGFQEGLHQCRPSLTRLCVELEIDTRQFRLLRVVTHPRVYHPPIPQELALQDLRKFKAGRVTRLERDREPRGYWSAVISDLASPLYCSAWVELSCVPAIALSCWFN